LLDAVLALKASKPTAVLLLPVVLSNNAFLPKAVPEIAVVLLAKEFSPIATLLEPVVFDVNAVAPKAVLVVTALAP
jgi:hypothetical protein